MCSTDLKCLQQIAKNTLNIEAFCYALGVALVGLSMLWVIQKALNYTIGKFT